MAKAGKKNFELKNFPNESTPVIVESEILKLQKINEIKNQIKNFEQEIEEKQELIKKIEKLLESLEETTKVTSKKLEELEDSIKTRTEKSNKTKAEEEKLAYREKQREETSIQLEKEKYKIWKQEIKIKELKETIEQIELKIMDIFYHAIDENNLDIITFLTTRKDYWYLKTTTSKTALEISIAKRKPEISKFLIETGVNLFTDRELIAELAVTFWPDTKINYTTLLGLTIRNEQLDTAKLLLEKGVKVTIENYTELHDAAKTGSLAAIILLLEHGANINAQDALGFTPLKWAENQLKVAKELKQTDKINQLEEAIDYLEDCTFQNNPEYKNVKQKINQLKTEQKNNKFLNFISLGSYNKNMEKRLDALLVEKEIIKLAQKQENTIIDTVDSSSQVDMETSLLHESLTEEQLKEREKYEQAYEEAYKKAIEEFEYKTFGSRTFSSHESALEL